jgi:hypothetical protein
VSDFRTRLKEVRDGLLRLHKTLLDSERATYERDVAKIVSTGQYLDLVLNDPWFQWLRQLSEFIVLIDETLARKEPPATAEEAAALITNTRALLVPAEEGTGFARKYFEVLQRDANAVLAHRDMLKVLGSDDAAN